MNGLRLPGPPVVSTPPSPIKPEMYDGTTDWSEYKIYFDQMSELLYWDEEKCAMMLGICLKGEAHVVFANLEAAQRRSYHALTQALMQRCGQGGEVGIPHRGCGDKGGDRH